MPLCSPSEHWWSPSELDWWADDWSSLPFCQLPRSFCSSGDSPLFNMTLFESCALLLSSSSGGCSVSQCCSCWSSLCSLLLLLQEERAEREEQRGGRGVYCCCPELCQTQQEECLTRCISVLQIKGEFNKHDRFKG